MTQCVEAESWLQTLCYRELLVRFKYFLFDLFRVRAISISWILSVHALQSFNWIFHCFQSRILYVCLFLLSRLCIQLVLVKLKLVLRSGGDSVGCSVNCGQIAFFFIAWKVNLIKTCSPWPLSFSSSSESNYTNTMCLWPHRLWCTSSCCHVELTLKPTVATVSSLFCLEKPIFAKIYHNQWARMGKSPQILL